MARAVFFGSDAFSIPVLEALLSEGLRLDPTVETVTVVARPDRPAGRGRRLTVNPVAAVADSRGVPVIQPERPGEEAVLKTLRALQPDVMVVASYGRILSQRLLDIPVRGCLNLHPSLLPKYRGPSPIQTSILEGERITGTTLILMTREMDAGPILAQERTDIGELETAGELSARLAAQSGSLLIRCLPAWLAGELAPVPQDESAASVTSMFTKEDGAIDWTQPAQAIAHRVLAFNPWPIAYSHWRDAQLRLLRAESRPGSAPPGHVSRLDGQALLIGTGDGMLALLEAQLPGGKRLPASAIVAGHPGIVGSTLESKVPWLSA